MCVLERVSGRIYTEFMTTDVIFQGALALPVRERAALAAELRVSMEAPDDDPAAVKAAWDAEIERRIAAIDDGTDPGVPWEDIEADLRARF